MNKLKKVIMGLGFIIASNSIFAQNIESFEGYNLPNDSFYNGIDGKGFFENEALRFPSVYDTTYFYWSGGWALSNKTQKDTKGFNALYIGIPGSGYQSSTYIIGQHGSVIQNKRNNSRNIIGFYVSNSAYSYWSMKEGDQFAKKFGGSDGKDPDYFLLTTHVWQNGSVVKSHETYLSDFRSSDNSKDFILSAWAYVDLTDTVKQGIVFDSLEFRLSSSDTGSFGMKTPAFFIVDKIETAFRASVPKADIFGTAQIFPNPATRTFSLQTDGLYDQLKIYDTKGSLVLTEKVKELIDISVLPSGLYMVTLQNQTGQKVLKLIKN
jgi:hypothetical protein